MKQDTHSLPLAVKNLREGAAGEAPAVWMLGPAGSGQTRLLAELTHSWRAALRHELSPATATAEWLLYPEELPRVRFLLTTGLVPHLTYDPAEDLAQVEGRLDLVLVTLRAADPWIAPLLGLLRKLRAAHPHCPILVAQTCLHELYSEGMQHPLPYAYDAEGLPGPAVPAPLAEALLAQRALFEELAGPRTRFVPLDLTEPEYGLAVLDYGATELHRAIAILAPEVAERLDAQDDPEHWIRRQVVLPWAAAAAATDAPPLPILGGLPAIAFQGMMVRAIARRFGLTADATIWASLIGVLGTGFLLRYALGWMIRQVLKLAPFWGGAAVATWTFAVTCGIGEAAIRLCREEAEGRQATPQAVREAFRRGQSLAGGAGKGGAPY